MGKEDKEEISHYGFIFLKEQVQALTKRVQELETVTKQVVDFLNSLEKVEEKKEEVPKEIEEVNSKPIPKKRLFGVI